jgi:2-polyprenyl-6-methoxyphenol hydroxylase-like FAD-dependent oxidoreductase
MPARPHVLIIGGGIAGPALALFLKKAGIAASIHEAYPRCADIGGGLQVAPNGMAVLDQIGLAGAVTAAGTACTAMAFRDQHGDRFATLPVGSPDRPAVTLKRARLHEILVEAATRAGIPVAYGRRLAAIEEDADGITARFADDTIARGDLLVGADGIHSQTRRLILPDAPSPAFTGLVGIGGFVPRAVMPPQEPEQAMTLCFGRPGAFFGYAAADRSPAAGLMWWSTIERDRPLDPEARAALTLEAVRRHLLDAGDGWFEPVPDILAAAAEMIAPIDIFDMPSLPRWWRGRAVLVGDAAHAVTPHSGQGASLALEDAICLAKRLRGMPAGAAASAWGQVFAGFEQDRRRRTERICALGRRGGDTKKHHGPVAGWLLHRLMPLILRLMAFQQRRIHRHRVRWEG